MRLVKQHAIKQRQAQSWEALLQGRRTGPHLARPFKIWSFIFDMQLGFRTQNCGTGRANGPDTDRLRAEIRGRLGPQERRLLAFL